MREFEGRLTGVSDTHTLKGDRDMGIDSKDLPPGARGEGRLSPDDAARMYDPLIDAATDPHEKSTLRLMRDTGIPLLNFFKGAGRPRPTREESDMDDEGLVSMKNLIERNKKILFDTDERDDYFNKLFSTTYAFPHKAFNEIFSPWFGPGREYVQFINLIQQASVGELPDYIRYDQRYTNLSDEEKKDFRKRLDEDFTRYQKEEQVISAIHDASRVLFYPSVDLKGYTDSVQQIDSLGGDVALRTPGVNQMINIIENVLRETMAANNGFLPPEAISGKVDSEERREQGKAGKIVKRVRKGEVELKIKERFKEWARQNMVFIRDDNGKARQEIKEFKDWEVERIFSTARGMMLIDGRLISLMAESTQPEQTAQYASLFLQDIIQGWSGFQHLIGKYGLTRKDLGILLFKDEKIKKIWGLISKWNPQETKAVLDQYNKDPRSILEDTKNSSALYYIMRENPLRAGDLWTWISWRLNPALKKEGSDEEPLGDEKSVESMIKDFMDKGRIRMKKRLDEKKKPSYIVDDKEYLQEYENWIGTGIRFEGFRGPLEAFRSKEDWDMLKKERADLKEKIERTPDGEEKKKLEEELEKKVDDEKVEHLLQKISELQGYRLWTNSARLRDRLRNTEEFKSLTKEQIENALADLSLVEAAFLKDRENILEKGGTFATASLENYYQVIKDEGRRKLAKSFQEAIAADYKSKSELYFEEYIYKRNYRHGFVLWDGDVPKDEFNFTRLAPTGGFARRARDNEHQGKAAGKVLEFMTNVRKMHKMEDVVNAVLEVHNEIALYDANKADTAVMELSQGIIKFFAERTSTKIPGWGVMKRMFDGKISFAKMVHGKEHMAWSSPQIETFIDQLVNLHLMKEEDAEKLREMVPASKIDIGLDIGGTILQLLLYWMITYMAEKSAKGKP